MPLTLNGCTYYATSEACRKAGTNRNTFLRWVREKRFADVTTRDRNGWRLFTDEDIVHLRDAVNRIAITGVVIKEN
jgi:DNA-binding transcriptional MerR regulator